MKSIEEKLPSLLHNINKKTGNEAKLEVTSECTFPHSFIGFEGHFPGNPILPAIVQLALIRCLAEKAFETDLIPLHYKRTKFKNMIRPNQKLLLSLMTTSQTNRITGKFTIQTPDSVAVSSGAFCFIKLYGEDSVKS